MPENNQSTKKPKITDERKVRLNTGVIQFFDEILNQTVNNINGGVRGICKRCGNIQTHSLIWCKQCGDKFFIPGNKMTVFDLMKIVRNSTGRDKEAYRPSYQAAIYKRKLRKLGYTEKEFIVYCELKLETV